jgi:hypothetical protein
MENNGFLSGRPSAPVKGGGGGVIEDPRAVENVVFQTRAVPLDSFEARLADDLMLAFGEGAETLEALVAALNAAASVDSAGAAWTESSLAAQLKASGDALFAPVPQEHAHG